MIYNLIYKIFKRGFNMRIGYACLQKGVYDSSYKTIGLKNISDEKLIHLISYNLCVLSKMLDYNKANNIGMFRISSDIIPFGSSHAYDLDWEDIFREELQDLSHKIRDYDIRLSVHPGQYTVLNSKDETVVERSIMDLNYHDRLLNALGTDARSKIILHIGGVYGDKTSAIERFNRVYKGLDDGVKSRLVIENDDRSYNIEDVLNIGNSLKIPVVFDNLHHKINRLENEKTDRYYILEARKTWSKKDGTQKIHYSQQEVGRRVGSHSGTIDLEEFKTYFKEEIEGIEDLDIMLEVKDKNLSAIKVNNLLFEDKVKVLEAEWGKYKYKVLEHSPANYEKIRKLLKDKSKYEIIEFYRLVDESLKTEPSIGTRLNGVDHVWGYFKDRADEPERKKYFSYLERYKSGTYTINSLKKLLLNLALKYDEKYLLNGYYFYF